jgi:hypothetical protein
MPLGNRELRLASLAVLLITLIYVGAVLFLGSIPAASGLFGHSLGILGFLLMVMTETLYSLRKRSRRARWGTMASWLQFHIFTGIVGPYLVLLHTSWKFNGLAGLLMLLTVMIVISGFIGRYIYTAVPRTVDGAIVESNILEGEIRIASEQIRQIRARQDPLSSVPMAQNPALPPLQGEFGLIFGRAIDDIRTRLFWRQQQKQLPTAVQMQTAQLEALLARHRNLERQVASLALARRMLALWHTIHIPIGMALFTVSILHIIAAIYYATLL